MLQVRRETSEEFKEARRKLEDGLREMEILKRKALRLEDENKHLVSIDSVLNLSFLFCHPVKCCFEVLSVQLVLLSTILCFSFCSSSFQTGVEEMFQLLKAENSLFQSQLDDMKAMEMDSQATIKNQEITINSLKTEKEVGNIFVDV